MPTKQSPDWQTICRAVSVEQNSERLTALLSDLIKSLDDANDVALPERGMARVG